MVRWTAECLRKTWQFQHLQIFNRTFWRPFLHQAPDPRPQVTLARCVAAGLTDQGLDFTSQSCAQRHGHGQTKRQLLTVEVLIHLDVLDSHSNQLRVGNWNFQPWGHKAQRQGKLTGKDAFHFIIFVSRSSFCRNWGSMSRLLNKPSRSADFCSSASSAVWLPSALILLPGSMGGWTTCDMRCVRVTWETGLVNPSWNQVWLIRIGTGDESVYQLQTAWAVEDVFLPLSQQVPAAHYGSGARGGALAREPRFRKRAGGQGTKGTGMRFPSWRSWKAWMFGASITR